MHELYEHTRKRPEMVTNGFEAAGINKASVNARTYVKSDEFVVG